MRVVRGEWGEGREGCEAERGLAWRAQRFAFLFPAAAVLTACGWEGLGEGDRKACFRITTSISCEWLRRLVSVPVTPQTQQAHIYKHSHTTIWRHTHIVAAPSCGRREWVEWMERGRSRARTRAVEWLPCICLCPTAERNVDAVV